MTNSSERRRHLRIHDRLVVLLKDRATGKIHRTLTEDLSSGGLRLVTSEPLEPGIALDGELKLPDRDQAIPFAGTVVWSRVLTGQPRKSYEPPLREIGLSFVRLAAGDQALIDRYARMNALPEGPPRA